MTKQILLLNGPNLNLLGKREPKLYGYETLADVEAMVRDAADEYGFAVEAKQSNHEGELVDWIQEARETSSAIIINPGAYSHTSIAILDALNAFDGAVVEVHVSNIHAREEFRHHSFVSYRANAVIVGQGVQGYVQAVKEVAALFAS